MAGFALQRGSQARDGSREMTPPIEKVPCDGKVGKQTTVPVSKSSAFIRSA